MRYEYYLLNINRSNKSGSKINEVDYWIYDKKIAPIFYGESRIKNILDSQAKSGLKPQQYVDAKAFCELGKEPISNNKIILSIGNEYIYLFRKKSQIQEYKKNGDSIVKGFKIDIIKRKKIRDIPLVLASIKANRWLSAGTFKPIRKTGNITAINFIRSNKNQTVLNFAEYLRCLSSVEFETLIAKIFEELGFFVPAYKGGFIRSLDLIVRNKSNKPIKVLNNKIPKDHNLAVQVKLNLIKRHYGKLDYYFCIESDVDEENVIDASKLYDLIRVLPKTKTWLSQTLYWVNFKNV